MTLREGLDKLSTHKLSVGTGFTGSGIEMKWRMALQKYWLGAYGIDISDSVRDLYMCDDGDDDLHEFLLTEWPDVPHLFRKVEELSCIRAFDVKPPHGHKVVPYVDMWSGGPTCTGKSGANNSRGTGGCDFMVCLCLLGSF